MSFRYAHTCKTCRGRSNSAGGDLRLFCRQASEWRILILQLFVPSQTFHQAMRFITLKKTTAVRSRVSSKLILAICVSNDTAIAPTAGLIRPHAGYTNPYMRNTKPKIAEFLNNYTAAVVPVVSRGRFGEHRCESGTNQVFFLSDHKPRVGLDFVWKGCIRLGSQGTCVILDQTCPEWTRGEGDAALSRSKCKARTGSGEGGQDPATYV